jgi:hypothetical protein
MKQSIEIPFRRDTRHSHLTDKISTLEAFARRREDGIKDHFGKPIVHCISQGEEWHGYQLLKDGKITPTVKQRRGSCEQKTMDTSPLNIA